MKSIEARLAELASRIEADRGRGWRWLWPEDVLAGDAEWEERKAEVERLSDLYSAFVASGPGRCLEEAEAARQELLASMRELCEFENRALERAGSSLRFTFQGLQTGGQSHE